MAGVEVLVDAHPVVRARRRSGVHVSGARATVD
jgi:hypothetical protein